MAAFERLAHHIDIAYALEAVVRAAACEFDKVRHQVVLGGQVPRVDEMGHAEFSRQSFARGVEVDADDLVGAGHARALHDIEAYAAKAENHHVGARFNLGRVDHRTDAGGDAATDVADLVEGRVLADFCQGDFR